MYFVITMTKFEKDKKMGGYDFGSTRTVGVFETIEEARDIVINNVCDICETIYDYALIEEVEYGLYPLVEKQELYKVKNPTVNKDGKEFYNIDLTYEQMDIPEKIPSYSLVVG